MRKSLFFGSFVALAALALLATTVFACTNFIGSFTVSGSGSGMVTATGNDTCTTYGSHPSGCTFGMSQSLSGSTSASHTTSGTFTIGWTVSSTIAANIAGTYDVNFVGGDAYNNNATPWQIDCMDKSHGITNVGSTTLTTSGSLSGTTTFNVPSGQVANSTSPAQESAVCISDSSANFGNEAPIALT